MKKVLLVNPSTMNVPYPVPPVGLCLLAAALEQEREVHLYDAMADGGEGLPRAIEEFRPDCVGLSVRNIDDAVMGSGVWFVETLRERFAGPLRRLTGAPVILGGSGFSIFPGELLASLDADWGIVGEAEESFPALIRALESGSDPLDVPGVLGRGQTVQPRQPAAAPDLGALPFSGIWRRLDYAPYRVRGAYPIQTKRGCAHACLYCTYPGIEGHRLRLRRPAAVADEIEEAAGRLGEITFEFVDSVFNDPPGHAEAVCSEIVTRGLRVRLRTMGLNPAGVTPLLLNLMRAAGFAQIDCTPDSASPVVLKNLRKNFSPKELSRTAEILRQKEMPTMWFFLLGGPGETGRTLRQTFDFIDRFVGEDNMAHLTEGLRIYPGTGLHQTALAEGVVAPGDNLLEPRFYVSPALGSDGLRDFVSRAIERRPNCVRAVESAPSAGMVAAALALRHDQALDEPMFRTLLRLRRQGLR